MHQLIEVQHENRSQIEHPLFDLIKRGKPIALRLDAVSTKLSKFKHPTLFLVPMSTMGGIESEVLVGLEGRGCEVLQLLNLDRTRLWKIGLSFYAADALIEEIAKVDNGLGD